MARRYQGAYRKGDPAPEGYRAWHAWADVQHQAGLRQAICVRCGLYQFPQEMMGGSVCRACAGKGVAGWRDGASDAAVAVMDTGAQDAALGAIRERWGAVPSAPWRWDDQPEGVIRVWFPEPHELTIGCVLFPGDMETYEGPDLRLAEALSAAPADIALLLRVIKRLESLLTMHGIPHQE